MATVPPFDPFSSSPFEESLKQAHIWSCRGGDLLTTSSPRMTECEKLVDRLTQDDAYVSQGLATAFKIDPDQDLYTSAMRSLNLTGQGRGTIGSNADFSARHLRAQHQQNQQQWNQPQYGQRHTHDPFIGLSYGQSFSSNRQPQQSFQRQYTAPVLLPQKGDEQQVRYRQPACSEPLIDLKSPPLRQIRGSSVNQTPIDRSYDLTYQLDRCQEQLKLMERERRKAEQSLSQLFPGKKVSGNNTIPMPKLLPKSGRVDLLIVDQIKEHAKIFTLMSLMEQLSGHLPNDILAKIQVWLESLRSLQTARQEEMVTATNGCLVAREVSGPAVSLAVKQLCSATRSARTTFWCAFMTVVQREAAARLSAQRQPLTAGTQAQAVTVMQTARGDPVIPVRLLPAPLIH